MNVTPRPISAAELALMRAWLDHDVGGAAELRTQVDETTLVFQSCDCGCASFGFVHPAVESSGVSVLDVDVEIVDDDGVPLAAWCCS